MFMRRRPLLRAAAVGGGAYMAGKARQRHAQEQEAQEADQDARLSNLEQNQQQQPYQQQQQPQQPPPAPAQPAGGGVSDQLKQLSALHEQGALTDEEFAAAKSKLLGL
ncbi:MAG TPA: SHOCT domain-containing protein [Streptosporangiaceae bacterium]|jgi:uncharacterized protein HemX